MLRKLPGARLQVRLLTVNRYGRRSEAPQVFSESKRYPRGSKKSSTLPDERVLNLLAGRKEVGARGALAEPVNDTGLLEIVWGHLKLHPIAIEEADETLAHFA